MKAWVGHIDNATTRDGAAARYEWLELPTPTPRRGEVLIRTRAVGLNWVDRYPKTRHFGSLDEQAHAIPGLEAAGEIAALGEGVSGLAIGDRVMTMAQGACAEYCCVPRSILMPVPPAMSWTDAAAIPVSYLTAHDALVTNGRLAAGGRVLIHAVTSGVGLAGLQLARLHGAMFVAGSSGSTEKLAQLRGRGLDLAIENPGPGFADAVLAATDRVGVDVVLDNVGGPILNETLRATAIGGRVIDIGRLGGSRAEINLDLLAVRRIALIGVTFRSRSLVEHAQVVTAFLADHGADLASGAIAPCIDSAWSFDALPQAIDRARQRAQFGKLVLSL